MAKFDYTPIDASNDNVQRTSVIDSSYDGTETWQNAAKIPQNFINADKLLSSITKAGNQASDDYDFKTRIHFNMGIDGYMWVKLVKIGPTVWLFTNQNGMYPVCDLAMFEGSQETIIPEKLRPQSPIILRLTSVGDINKGFTGSMIANKDQFMRINPDGTIDTQIHGVNIWGALGSRTVYFAVSGMWDIKGD